MVELYANNAHGVLSVGISDVDLSLSLDTGEGARFPNPSGLDFFRCSIETADGLTTEIVFVSARSGDNFTTIVRGQEGTTPSAFPSGSRVRLRPTAGMLERIAGVIADEQLAILHGYARSGVSPITYINLTLTANGSGTHVHGAVSDTSFRTSFARIEKVASNTAANGYALGSNGVRVTRGSTTNAGGFDQIWIFGINADIATMYGFWGVDDNNAASYSGGSPETNSGQAKIGVGFASGSSPGGNFFLYHHDGGGGAVTAIDTGIPRTTTGIFRLRIWCAPNAASVNLLFEDLETGVAFAATLTTNLPAGTAFLNAGRAVVGGVIGAGIDFYGAWRFNVNQSEPELLG